MLNGFDENLPGSAAGKPHGCRRVDGAVTNKGSHSFRLERIKHLVIAIWHF